MHFILKHRIFAVFFVLFTYSFVSISNLYADVIELEDQKKLYGQLISITDEMILIETFNKENAFIKSIFLPRNKVIKITDESGTILFSDNKQNILILKRYYSSITSNWEELKDRIKGSANDTLYFKDGSKAAGKVLSITDEYVFSQKTSDGNSVDPKIQVNKFRLNKINKINKIKVFFIDAQKSHPIFTNKVKYPVYSISGGIVLAQTNYNQLQDLFQEFYDKSAISYEAEKRLSAYFGGQIQFEIFVKPYLSIGYSGFFYRNDAINSLGMSMANIKYTFHQTLFRPWLSLGFAGHDFSSAEKPGETKYIWDTSKGAPSMGLGIDLGDELGKGYYLAAHYLPFGKGTTKIKDSDITVNKEIDFAILLFSIGMRFNFN
ncbi:MAG: hypothetical protein D8M58_05800 [Calditrichaeota bacterium]|nr:MAG: hypothetical protein DWQ03_20705 [Calditrichota bacterium]MBL1204891.1 hypothetical protein [Calditrichota bacterium]NOG44720.1 hypothetical protein [Calditrichota bacterium]